MRGLVVFLLIFCVVLIIIAPFTVMNLFRTFLPEVYDKLIGDVEQEETIEPSVEGLNVTRSFDKNLSSCVSFITPEDTSVVELKNIILKSKPVLTPNWIALRDWVGTNIVYRSDREIYDRTDFWQLPNETIPLRTGDCEDISILLCSLLRSDGWSPDKVYVIIGEKNYRYHAWVRLTWENVQYNIEPQLNGFAVTLGDVLNLSGYNAKYYFNDEKMGTFQ